MRKIFPLALFAALPLAAQTHFDDHLVVTASLATEGSTELPATVRVLSGEEIERRQQLSAAEALAVLPGVQAVVSGPPGQQTSLFVRGTNSSHVLVLWNGIPLNDPYFGGFNWAFLPADAASRIEVASGPYSALYGSEAVGGVVQLLTRPGSQDALSLRLEAGEHGHLRGGAQAAVAGDAWRLHGFGHVKRGGSEFANDDFDSEELSLRLDWQPTAALELGLLGRRNDSETQIPFNGGQPSPGRQIRWQEEQVALPVAWERGTFGIEALLSHHAYDSHFSDPLDAFGFTEQQTDAAANRGRVVVTHRPGPQLWWALGGESEQRKVSDRSSFGVQLDDDSQRTSGVFGQLHWQRASWSLEGGLRYDDSDSFGGALSPRLGLTLQPLARLRLRASYGAAYRAPSVGELFFPGTGNPELEPEESDSFEVGATWRQGSFSADLVGFWTELEQLIDFDLASFRNVNVGEARSRGVELALSYRRGPFDAGLGATWLDAEDRTTGEALLRRSDFTADLVAGWRAERWQLTLVSSWVGDRPDVDPVTFSRRTNDAYHRHDLMFSWQPNPRWQPYGRVDNLTDEEYAPALGFPAPGRSFVVGLRWSS